MKYDYQELIDEIKDEIGDGLLKKSSIIQILRDEKAEKDGYFPIIDWFYNKSTMAIELAPDKSDTKEEINEKKMIREQYQQDEPFLTNITVEACLAEMFEKSK
jgi:hypothetical protein